MQSANTYFSEDGFKKFQCNSQVIEKKGKGFYYLFDNKLFVLRQKVKKEQNRVIAKNLENQDLKQSKENEKLESGNDVEYRLHLERGGDDMAIDEKNKLNSQFLSMIKEQKYHSQSIGKDQQEDIIFEQIGKDKSQELPYYLMRGQELDKYQGRERLKKSNFVISVYQMPELSHIKDIQTGLLRVSSNTKLVVKSSQQFILYDNYCVIMINTMHDLNNAHSHQVKRNYVFIDDNNEMQKNGNDKIIGIACLESCVHIYFRKSYLKFSTSAQKTSYHMNELEDSNSYSSNSNKEILSLDKVLSCEGNVGIGIVKGNTFDLRYPGYFVFINQMGQITQKKPLTGLITKNSRQRIKQFLVFYKSDAQETQTNAYILSNQQLSEFSLTMKIADLKLDEKAALGATIFGAANFNNEEKYCSDQPYQLVMFDNREGKKYVVIDFLNSNMQTYTFCQTDDMPIMGIINNKNYILNTDKNQQYLENIYLGDIRFCQIQFSKSESSFLKFKINHLPQTLKDSQIYQTRFLCFNNLEIPFQNRFRQKQICSTFMKKRLWYVNEQNKKKKATESWKSSMKDISLTKLALVINQHYKWNWRLQQQSTLCFTKSKIELKCLKVGREIQEVSIKLFDNKQTYFVTISPDLKHIFKIADDNYGYIQRLKIDDDQINEDNLKQYEYSYKFENSFDVVSFTNGELILIRFTLNPDEKQFRLHLEKYSYQFDSLNNSGTVKMIMAIDLSRYNKEWDQVQSSFQDCIKEKKDNILRFGEYNFVFKNYIIIQQKNEVLVFMKDSFEFKGSYRFNDYIRKLKVIDNELYIDQDNYEGEICLQGEEDFFAYLNRLNPEKLNLRINQNLQKITYLNPDDNERIGTITFRNGYQIFMHRMMFNFDPQDLEIQEYINNLDENQLALELGKNMQNLDGTFSHTLVTKSYRCVQFLQKRLALINKKNIPMLFRYNIDYLSPFDIAKSKNDFQSIIIMMNIMIKYQNYTVHNYLVDPHINFLIEKKANLEDYFNSNLPMSKIRNKSYMDYSTDSSTLIHADFNQAQSVNYIMNNYDEIFENVKLDQEGSATQIEYLLVNMPKTIQSIKFIQNLSQVNDLDIFESECIQVILDYKWETYTNKFFLMQFTIFILFLIAYVIDIYFFVVQGSERELSQQLIVKLVCASTLLGSGYYEFILMRKQTLRVYIQESWNVFDLWMILHYFVILIIDVQNRIPEGIVILQGVMLMLVFLKLCQNLRIFQGFSFQVTMLQAVFYDIKYFILLYAFVIFIYGLIFTLLKIKTSEENDDYQGINLFGYFIMAFRASTGDFQIDQFKELQEEHIIYAWIMWISAVLFLNIILLNFIIAVISESYEKVMQKMRAESYRIKCQLIKEREQFLEENDLKDEKKFPKYIILRRPVTEKEDSNSEWQGFVKDIKKNLLKVSQTLSLDIDTKHQEMLCKLDLVMKDHQHIKDEMIQMQKVFGKMFDQQNNNLKQYLKEDKEELLKEILKLNVQIPKEEIKEAQTKE
eukprot:403337249